jgi:hypothetical protein
LLLRRREIDLSDLYYQGSSICPLHLHRDALMEEIGISAFIFYEGNSSVLNQQPNPVELFAIDLGSLPATLNKLGAGLDLDLIPSTHLSLLSSSAILAHELPVDESESQTMVASLLSHLGERLSVTSQEAPQI